MLAVKQDAAGRPELEKLERLSEQSMEGQRLLRCPRKKTGLLDNPRAALVRLVTGSVACTDLAMSGNLA